MTAPARVVPVSPLDGLIDIDQAIDLVDSKVTLLADYKLEYPQDYSPGDIAAMGAEIERLKKLRAKLEASR